MERADVVIENTGGLESFHEEVRTLLAEADRR
jgi:dephospho-CoA kinase